MNKEFEAYHSRAYSLVFIALFALITALNVGLNVLSVADIYVTILLGLTAGVTVYLFILYVTKSGIAIEVIDGAIVLYKKEPERFSFDEIKSVSLHVGYGSFDIRVKTYDGRKSGMSCFVKGDRLKKKELMALLESKGIDIHSYDID